MLNMQQVVRYVHCVLEKPVAGVVCDEVMSLPLSVAKTQKYDWVGMQTGLGV